MSTNNYKISAKEMTNKNGAVINLSGELTIENSIPIQNFLGKQVNKEDCTTLIIEKSDSIDLSIIQLIIGFIRARNKQNTATKIEYNLDDDIMELLNKSGVTALLSNLQIDN